MKKIIILGLIMMLCIASWSQIIGGDGERITFNDSIFRETANYRGDLHIEQYVPVEQTRRIYFIHGLGADASSWTTVSDACWDPGLNIAGFPARDCEVSRVEYSSSTNGSLSTASYDVATQIRNQALNDIHLYDLDPNKAFIIAHSQGGLVARTMVHHDIQEHANLPYFGKGYGGIVTVAAPLNGAEILNNRDDILRLAEDACNNLSAGPQAQNILIRTIVNLFAKDIVNQACDLVSNTVMPMFFDDYFESITDDYKVGASWLERLESDRELNEYRVIPKVAFYAVEPTDNIFWRTANWFTADPNESAPFGANDDKALITNLANPMYSYYNSKVIAYNNIIRDCDISLAATGWMLFTIPIILGVQADAIKKRNAWAQGTHWLRNVNNRWLSIIGGLDIRQVNGQFVTTHYENDGVVVANSAMRLPLSCNHPVRIYPNEGVSGASFSGSSHMQVRNDSGLKHAMRRLCEGEFGIFFATNAR